MLGKIQGSIYIQLLTDWKYIRPPQTKHGEHINYTATQRPFTIVDTNAGCSPVHCTIMTTSAHPKLIVPRKPTLPMPRTSMSISYNSSSLAARTFCVDNRPSANRDARSSTAKSGMLSTCKRPRLAAHYCILPFFDSNQLFAEWGCPLW